MKTSVVLLTTLVTLTFMDLTWARMDETCSLPKVVGPCMALKRKYYYDTVTNKCTLFNYGGCQGNDNRFNTETDCQAKCSSTKAAMTGGVEEVCSLPVVVGPCRGKLPKYYFDATTNKCTQFGYGGCQGNGNRFNTEDECKAQCDSTQPAKNEVGEGRNQKNRADGCRYNRKAAKWSECDDESKKMTKIMTLKESQPDSCDATKTIERTCGTNKRQKQKQYKCTYWATSESDCDEVSQTKNVTVTLQSGHPDICDETKYLTEPCTGNCQYERHVTDCVDNKRTISYEVKEGDDTQCAKQPKEKPCGAGKGKGKNGKKVERKAAKKAAKKARRQERRQARKIQDPANGGE